MATREARRFLLTVQKTATSGQHVYDHIAHVAEYYDSHWGHLSDAQVEKKFRDRVRNIERGNPTRKITMEPVFQPY